MAEAARAEFPFESRFVEVLGSRIQYIEEGRGRTFLFLHGNPTWSYLWRNVIPPIAERARCVALDLPGFGMSDKPKIGYRFQDHYRYVEGFVNALGLRDVVLVGHDWGGALGFAYALRHRENVKGIAFMETFPFVFRWEDFSPKFRLGFRMFRTPVVGHFLIMVMNVFVNRILPASVHGSLPEEVLDNYRKPFPTIRSRYPVYVWPNELPILGEGGSKENETLGEIRKIEESLPEFKFPMLLVCATPGAVIPEAKVESLKGRITDLTVRNIGKGIHFLQEDNPEGVARAILEWASARGLLETGA